jgi:hypothetical protein
VIRLVLRSVAAVLAAAFLIPGFGARADPYLQLELGVLPRTEIDVKTGEHLKIDTRIAAIENLVTGWDFGAWRLQLALGHRYLETDGMLAASFQTNGSLRLWSGLVEVLRDLDLSPTTGLPLAAFAGLGGGVTYADMHDFGRGNGSEVVPTGSAQLGLTWRLRDGLALLGGSRLIATGTFDSPGEEPGEPKTHGRLTAVEFLAGLRLDL